MIRTEFYMTREDGVGLYRTYSDADFMIRQIPSGILYTEAVDVENSGNSYEETDIPIDSDVPDNEALEILLGGEADEDE